jgi:hypothetical protein
MMSNNIDTGISTSSLKSRISQNANSAILGSIMEDQGDAQSTLQTPTNAAFNRRSKLCACVWRYILGQLRCV